jgi:hypothetical protein
MGICAAKLNKKKQMMQTKNQVILFIVLLAGSFCAGRYFAPIKIHEVITEVEKKHEVTDTDKHETIVEITQPDGSKKKTTEIITETKKNVNLTLDKIDDITKEYKRNTTSISVLIGGQIPLSPPIYGIQVQKQLLGPIIFGVWGMTDKTAGISVGLTF